MAASALRRRLPNAPQALQDILDPALGTVEPPIRSEIFGPQRFAQHGRSLGESHRAVRSEKAATFFPRLRDNIRTLRAAYRYIGLQAGTGYDLSPAAEWLLDNFHLIEAQLDRIHEGLPRRYFRALPVLVDPPLAGLPRVYGVAWAFVAHTDSAFDEALLIRFLGAYQETRELDLGEMWALPTTLRVVLVENLRRLAERVASNKAAREVANLCCDHIADHSDTSLDDLLAQMNARGVGRMFLTQMAQRLQDGRPLTRHVDDPHASANAPPASGDRPPGVAPPERSDRSAAALPKGSADSGRRWLRGALPEPAAALIQQRAEQTADNLSVSNAVSSLRAIGDADWSDIVAQTSTLMRVMLRSAVFAAEDHATRDHSLHRIEALSRRSGRSEVEVATALIGLMDADVAASGDAANTEASHWLRGEGRAGLLSSLGLHGEVAHVTPFLLRHLALPAYLAAVLGLTLAWVWAVIGHSMWAAFAAGSAAVVAPGVAVTGLAVLGGLAALLMLFPASEAAVALVHRLISESVRPHHLARLAFQRGIPPEHRVLVVIPSLLTDARSTAALVHRLHLHHLANPERHAQFALLTDWADAGAASLPGDAALLDDALAQVRDLNTRCRTDTTTTAPRFIVLHREREFSDTEQRWIGRERKRGKLEALIAAIATDTPGPFIEQGSLSHIAAGTRYVLTLDSDTQLPPGRLRELVAIAAHPHNTPQLAADGRRVERGHAILQPRLVTPLPDSARTTPFHRLFAGQPGIDPYSVTTSEVYQDVFGEGSFTGKGLLNVAAVHAVLGGRLPVEQVLSHDLLEGAIARCAMVTDVTLIEDAPFHADVAASRVHRWTRGDWQLVGWLWPRWRGHGDSSAPATDAALGARPALGSINRWKLLDNLRRSLVAPTSLGLLLLSLAAGVVSPWSALAVVIAAVAAGPLMGALAACTPSRDDVALGHFYRQAAVDIARAFGGAAWMLVQLPAHAIASTDAIVRTLWRLAVSRRHLLQWTTAAAAESQSTVQWPLLWARHRHESLFALLIAAVLWAVDTPTPVLSATLCLVWMTAPWWTWWVSRPNANAAGADLSADDRAHLEGVARDSWRLFERCVGPADRHLPPDNLQTDPFDMVAHRTSPTNIGMYLLSAACARSFGWITTVELCDRLEATLATLATLPRHRGHFLNWIATETGAALLPMYVSTVDSGNLSGHLIAVAQACREFANDPGSALTGGEPNGDRLIGLAGACERIAWEADFSFLYHPKRHLFHIGYRVAEQQLDASFYDLLASESRLTSLLAIAKGDVPVSHWAALGRLFFANGTRAGLRSWSGSMFEYLMPTLMLEEPQGSVLREAGIAALSEQVAYARRQGVPWGISESAHAARDHTLAYQYGPQGVPQLALRRTPPDELVIAPYATALAALIDPRLCCENFSALEALGARSELGFIEALDYTPGRNDGIQPFSRVSTFMAHHQGMTIVAIANALQGGVAQRWGMANAHLEAVSSLLHERTPREVPMRRVAPAAPPPQSRQRRALGMLRELEPGASALEPTQLLSNGRYSVTLRPNGAGWSRWGPNGINRWRDDALRDACGSFLYLRWDDASVPVSITQHPAPDPAAHYRATFHADRVGFSAAWPGLEAHTTVWVSPEDDIEFRQVELRNLGDRTLDLELLSAFEVTLADPRADEAHPAFGNLFVSADWLPAQQALVFERRPRLATERGMQAAHFIAAIDPPEASVRVQTDRARWAGRNRSSSEPLASFDPLPQTASDDDSRSGERASAESRVRDEANGPAEADAEHSVRLDSGLDPVAAIAVRLRIGPQAKVCVTFATAASDHTATLRAVIDKYRQASHVQRASLMSATLAGIRLRSLRIGAEQMAAVQDLTTALACTLTRPMPADALVSSSDRRRLWRFGISGERPIVLVNAGQTEGAGLLRSMAQALRLWSWGGIACDLVVVNAELASYEMPLQRELTALRERHGADSGAEFRAAGALAPASTTFHVLRTDELSPDELATLTLLARVRLLADGRPLAHHVHEWVDTHDRAQSQRRDVSQVAVELASTVQDTGAVPAPQWSFSPGSAEFSFDVGMRSRPARPWVNVLANPGFGTHLSESGAGCTWAGNSRMNQLTAWSNDPVADPPSEWVLLQDTRTLETWSVAPSAWGDPARTAQSAYRVSHGQGHSVISHQREGLEVEASWCVDAQTAVKQVRVTVVNRGPRTRHLRVIGMVEWMMGAQRSDRASVRTESIRQQLSDVAAHGEADAGDVPGADDDANPRNDWWPTLPQVLAEKLSPLSNALSFVPAMAPASASPAPRRATTGLTVLLATQSEAAGGHGNGTAFLAGIDASASDDDSDDWTCDRREFFDDRGRLVVPDHLLRASGAGLDPCAAMSTRWRLGAGERVEKVFLLGHADTPDAARLLAVAAASAPASERIDQARRHWDELLGSTVVSTPDPLFDALVNRWLLYQTVVCRMWARAGFYQAGGAYGFRDQLQDAMALTWAAPAMLREQIVRHAGRQFIEGDVQHWWHEPGGAGVRTHFSDDLLWLAVACARYLKATGDASLWDEAVPFLYSPPIPAGAEDLYATPAVSTQAASVYEHAARAIDHSLRVGAHGLPLMGTGDWNDGMNRVGHAGRGESVWLGWFLCRIVDDFAPIARERGEPERAARWDAAAVGWRAALEGPGWDGEWYARAFFDDGSALGAAGNAEARIDLIAQAWSVLSGAAPIERQRQAMAAAEAHLIDSEHGLIRLLYPPLARAEPSAGYIQAYPPGVRENGGQYSHAGVWMLMAQAALGDEGTSGQDADDGPQRPPGTGLASSGTSGIAAERVWRSFMALSPAHRSRDPERGAVYGLEPYVMAGDVCTAAPHEGRGGWSWYTGAAAWMHRAAIESIFGLRLDARTLSFEPCLPPHWAQAELTLKRNGRTLRFILWRIGATEDANVATQASARPAGSPSDAICLRRGERLNWTQLPVETCFVIALALND